MDGVEAKDGLLLALARLEGLGRRRRVLLRRVIRELGDNAPLILAFVLSAPMALPATIPGSSILIGIVLMLLAYAAGRGRAVRVPACVGGKVVGGAWVGSLAAASGRAVRWFGRAARSRWFWLTGGWSRALLCVLVGWNGFLLALPLTALPLTNTAPGLASLLLCGGLLYRDGALAVLGVCMSVVATVYLGGVTVALVWVGWEALVHLFGG